MAAEEDDGEFYLWTPVLRRAQGKVRVRVPGVRVQARWLAPLR
ncbi:hypothetical protein SLEP1_g38839 [Rubroshorea leprosula]|uniref:Uncharacterized protein n=1 Tax=Rubroshorea leprosula TaxID=152421 RepID=A0AAV5KZD3_9ROSI|nr:hypothetical protein SLEP1_g38839 [Rubroshorea leprosula]